MSLPISGNETNIPSSGSFKVYKAPSAEMPSQINVPDSFFAMTPADVKLAQSQLAARTDALVNAPLQSKSIQAAASKAAKLERWPTTTIRVRFPDRTQLEKTYPSTDKIRSVYAFVRSTLRDDVKPIKFILYQSPPKRDLKVSDPKVRDQTLMELQLAPSSVLLLRFEDEALNRTDVQAPLLESILAQVIDFPTQSQQDSSPSIHVASPSSSVSSAPTSSAPSEKKIPKWFKMNKNK